MCNYDLIERHVPQVRGVDRSQTKRYARLLRTELTGIEIFFVRTVLHLFMFSGVDPAITSSVHTYVSPEDEDEAIVRATSEVLTILEGDHA